MDSHAECGKTFELGETSATVYGKGAVQNGNSPLSCTIILSTDGIREHRRFTIEVVSGFIKSPGINFYIYDGQWSANFGGQTLVSTPGSRLLKRCRVYQDRYFMTLYLFCQAQFTYTNNPPTNMQRLITSGGFVTFSLTRDSPDLFGYGFVIRVIPTPGKTNKIC
jgi:hypothetical protein